MAAVAWWVWSDNRPVVPPAKNVTPAVSTPTPAVAQSPADDGDPPKVSGAESEPLSPSPPDSDPPKVSAAEPEPLSRFRDCAEWPEMVVIPAGSFMMGSPEDEEGRDSTEGPQRRVQMELFAVGRTEVTFAAYDRFASVTGRALPDAEGWGRGDRPVINVSWEDAIAYAEWLTAQTGQKYRLPSEAEWEYAARAGTTGAFSFVGLISPEKANYDGTYTYGGSREDSAGYRGRSVPAGSLPANAWGLHEVHGNVWEWVTDCWHDDYQGAPRTGGVWEGGHCRGRVLRGGSWNDNPDWLRSATRYRNTPTNRDSDVGFRLARTL